MVLFLGFFNGFVRNGFWVLMVLMVFNGVVFWA